VHKSTWTVNSTYNMGHTSLVSTESGKVRSCRGVVILWEGTDASSMVLGTLLWKESKMAVTRCFELTMRHDRGI
jgi:hypothetical protein